MPRVHKAVEARTFAVTLCWPLGWRLAGDVEELHTQYQAVRRENQELRNAVGVLGSKCDYLENQSRRNNLLFFGFPAVPAGTEHWDECERKVKEASKEGMGITEDILIERAHRSGCKVPFI